MDEPDEIVPFERLGFEDLRALKSLAAELFSPRTPIDTSELFAGRFPQLTKLDNAIRQAGAHVIIYGERGVGKTSLANISPAIFSVFSKIEPGLIVAPMRVNCDGTDTYHTIWSKVFSSIHISESRLPIGFLSVPENVRSSLLDQIAGEGEFTPGTVLDTLKEISNERHVIITLDEFDRIESNEVTSLIADTVKSLSDHRVQTTLQIVGVGDSVATLVEEHESVGRHLVEIPLPRMEQDELRKIVTDRLPKISTMEITEDAIEFIALVSAGLPYFMHLLSQHAVCMAIDASTASISRAHADEAVKCAIDDSEREMKQAYYKATQSRHPKSSFRFTLAACALATRDEFGYFTASDIRDSMARIKGTTPKIASFHTHLERFCSVDFGGILHVTGSKHNKRYRFRNPLMQPFVIIKSLADSVIDDSHI